MNVKDGLPAALATSLIVVILTGCGRPEPVEEAPPTAPETPPAQEESAAAPEVTAAPPSAPSQGLHGRVALQGTPPSERTIVMDAMCARQHGGSQVTTRHYVVGADDGLGDVFVYVKEGVTGEFEPPAEVPVLDQVDCIYTPFMMGVMSGQTFQVRNSDSLLHNVNTTRTRFSNRENRPFNIAQPTKGRTDDVTYHGRELFVQFRCDVHPWMFAYVAVMEHPYFAVTDENGYYSIPNLPPGDYIIEAIHLRAGTITQELTVPEGAAGVDFTFEAGGG